ncbi:copper amine oxidase N-terminal domain-containing protein [[Clostridium] colinum]|uniref:copper amine oxidase N-terminal domain-containing protein n=1 Tax=[Clostridium] colinum TaxID=36835 RepID=UPI002025228D|nr:copper amine oxidase N-terminal domain-containing protein [[Clostridium] colinum]
MKRKIAILLSAMMVTSAMPLSANAAQLKADSVLNTTFAKAGETIDPNAKDYASAEKFKTVSDLKSRKSVVKIALNNDGTENIGETTFKVQLENGTFDESNLAAYQYYNSNGTDKVTYEQAMNGAKSLTDVYNNIVSNSKDKATITVNSAVAITEFSEFNTMYDAELKSTGNKLDAVTSQATFEAVPEVKAELDKIKAKVLAEQNRAVPELAHIPYTLKIDSPTTATVTVPNLDLKDSDKEINMGTTNKVTEDQITFKFYDSMGVIADSNFTKEKIKSDGGNNKITKIEVVISKGTENTKVKDPYIALPLGAVKADGNSPVKVKIVSDYNDKVKGGEYTLTKAGQEGETTLEYSSSNIKSFEDYAKLSPVVIKENVRGTIGNSKGEATITLRVNGGFRFKTGSTLKFFNDKTGKELTVDTTGTGLGYSGNDSVLKVKVSGLETNRTTPIGIRVEGLQVEATNDKNFGNVDLTVSGDGISSATKTVAKREKLGFKLETLKDAKEIISGRHYSKNDSSMSEQDNTTVEVKFSEAVSNTLVKSRALDFNVPEGVKIVGIDLSKINNFNGLSAEDFEIVNHGKTLRLKRDSYEVKYGSTSSSSVANFVLKLNLSVDPGFKGDIKLGVTGGGQSNVTEAVVAKAVIPFEIKSNTTKANIGYQNYSTADIVITEAKPGMFLENKEAVLYLSAPYGTQELGFSEAKFEVSGGELEVKEKDFKVGDVKDSSNNTVRGAIKFKINKASYKNPSTITIKNVKVGTTRSVPFGAYDLKLAGDAVINNYDSKVEDDKTFSATSKDKNLVNQNNTSSYVFKEYVNVITETGTFDQTVKVSVGEKTVLVGDKTIDMDVAPYIQASSNSTMVPLRFVSVALGVDSANVTNPDASNKIAFDANTKTTTIYYGAGTGQKIIQFQAGSNIMVVDGTRIPMEFGVKAEIKDGRMFVPFRALGQALGVAVSWNADTRTAIYNENASKVATTTAATTTSTTASTTTTKESTTQSTTASKDSTTETTTAKK